MDEQPAARWEGVDAAELSRRWKLPQVHLFERVGSTNDLARRLAAQGVPAGTLVLAERQLRGRGRVGRAWDSPPGLGLWLSLVLRPRELPEPGALPLRVGLTVATALDPFLRPGRAQVKWPNDLLAGGRKLGGILCEGTWEGGRPGHVVAGIGLNVLHGPQDFPEALRGQATSVRIATGGSPDRLQVATAVIRALAGTLSGPLALTPAHLAELESRDFLRGRKIVVRDPVTAGVTGTGTALGVAPDGALLLRTPTGGLRPVRSGTARLA